MESYKKSFSTAYQQLPTLHFGLSNLQHSLIDVNVGFSPQNSELDGDLKQNHKVHIPFDRAQQIAQQTNDKFLNLYDSIVQLNQPSYYSELAFANDDFRPFEQDLYNPYPFVLDQELNTQNYNNYKVDLDYSDNVCHLEFSGSFGSRDHTQEKSSNSNQSLISENKSSISIVSFNSEVSNNQDQSSSSSIEGSQLDLCDLFISSDKQRISQMKEKDQLSREEKQKNFDLPTLFIQEICDQQAINTQQKIKIQLEVPLQQNNNQKQKKKVKSKDYSQYGRKDIVLKTILRQVRKHYLTQFNEMTGYIKSKRYKNSQFYLSQLQEYITVFNIENPHLREELIFFLGSIFYPKHLQKCFQNNARKKVEIDDIHSGLYKFTIQKLNYLEQYGSYHFLLENFLTQHKDSTLEENKTMEKARQDFILGFNHLQERLISQRHQ